MDPDERQRQREARRRARQEITEASDEPAQEQSSSVVMEAETVRESLEARDDQERRDQEDREAKEREEQELSRQQRIRERQQQEIEERQREEREREREEMEREQENERARQAAQEAARQKKAAKKPEKKRKGLGGLSPEKKRMLKQLIMQKAAEEMKAEAKKRQEEKENHLAGVVPKLEVDSPSIDEITKVVKKYYDKLCSLEGDKYDWEIKLRTLDFEINELTLKVNNAKGKFVKPVLKRVSKTDGIWSKLDKHRSQNQISFRDQLKSTGQNKFALDEKEETHKNPDWREHLKPKDTEEVTEEVHVEM